ncbi:unnamed protein product [Camellia sinensis]
MIDSHKRIAIDNGTDDIVSGLPRNLIDNILERMPVRDAARTSILSRNWRRPVPWVLAIPFNQLKHLVFTKLRFDDVDQMSCAPCLLRSSPNMKKHHITASAVRDNAVESVPRYLVARGCMYQLLNQLFLETICVQYHQIFDAQEGFRISTKMIRFSRASPRAM